MKSLLLALTVSALLRFGASAQPHWESRFGNNAQAISIHAFGGGNGVAVSGYGRVLKTADGGATWKNVGTPETGEFTSACFVDSALGWRLNSQFGNFSVQRTLDGGTTWSAISSMKGYMSYLHFSDPDHGWGAGYRSVYRTSDGGRTWKKANVDTTKSYAGIFSTDSATGWVIADGNRLMHTANAGRTWTVQDSGLQGLSAAMQFLDAETGWIGVHSDSTQLLRTTNGGKTWTRHRVGKFGRMGALHFVDAKTGWLAAGDTGAIYRTDDGGVTWEGQWTARTAGFTSIDFRDALFGFATGADNLILNTVDGGAHWVAQNGRLPRMADAQLVTPKIGWAVGYDQIAKTRNGGLNWVNQYKGPGSPSRYLEVVRFADTATGLVGGIGLILKTADGGATWRPVYQDTTRNAIHDIQFLNGNSVVAVGDMGMLRSADGGETWTPIPMAGVNTYVTRVRFAGPDTGWILAGGGTAYKTTDAGKSWSMQSSRTVNAVSMFFLNAKVGWIVGGASTLVKTNDGGKNWVEQWPDTGRHVSGYSVHFSDAKNGWMLAGNVIYASKDGGVTWTPEPMPEGQFLMAMSFFSPEYALAVGPESLVMRSTETISGIRAPSVAPRTKPRRADGIRIRIGPHSGVDVSGFDMQGRSGEDRSEPLPGSLK